jgi:hypothetical protein
MQLRELIITIISEVIARSPRSESSPKESTAKFSILYVWGTPDRRGLHAAVSAGALSTPLASNIVRNCKPNSVQAGMKGNKIIAVECS